MPKGMLQTLFYAILFFTPLLQARFSAVATETCPAYNDLRHSRNSGNLYLQPGKSYEVLRRHKGQLLVKIPATPIVQRWVDPACFTAKGTQASSSTSTPIEKRHSTAEKSDLPSLLVLSWHNAFCESHANRKECRPLGNRGTNHLVLHGLWPQPASNLYCGVPASAKEADRSRRWRSLPEPKLSSATKRLLLSAMPGSASGLERHEWIKHGTCYDSDPERFFHDALSLTHQVDRSMLGEYLRSNLGKRVTLAQLRKLFERSFGKGTGSRLAMECRRGLLQELRINIRGKGDDLKKLLPRAPALHSRCQSAVVDAPGRYRK